MDTTDLSTCVSIRAPGGLTALHVFRLVTFCFEHDHNIGGME